VKRIVLIALALLAGIVAGLGALVGVAALTERVLVFLLAGLVAFGFVYLLALLLVTRGTAPERRTRDRVSLFAASTAIVTGLFALTALRPLDDPRLPPAAVADQRYWDLPTGSRIAYVHLPAQGDPQPAPVVFLHGGPGVPDLAGDSAYFGNLTREGFDVYVYDQVGRGRSSRLDDPRAYTVERDVADLEAIRRAIGADQMTLIGLSNGGLLAAAYAADFPQHVKALVLTSPGDPAPAAGGASLTGRLSLRQQLGVYSLLQPRALLGYVLLQVNPRAAHAFAGDAEMDARFDRVYNRSRPALHCPGKPPGPELHGLGFYAHYFPQSAARTRHADFLPVLTGQRLPTLIIKGRCDYLSWSSAVAYLEALPDARLVYFPEAGHNVYQDEPEQYLTLVRAFLLDQPLPEPVAEGRGMPDGYEGPA
jgi:proline iminopeptidase